MVIVCFMRNRTHTVTIWRFASDEDNDGGQIEVDVSISGKWTEATRWSPAEGPDVDDVEATLVETGERVELTDAEYDTAVERAMELDRDMDEDDDYEPDVDYDGEPMWENW